MLLIIEDRNDPTGSIAEETGSSAGIAYISTVKIPGGLDPGQVQTECAVNRLAYRQRNVRKEESSSKHEMSRIPLFLKAVGRMGQDPEYLTAEAQKGADAAVPDRNVRLSCRG